MKHEPRRTTTYLKLECDDFLKLVSGGRVEKTDLLGNRVVIILEDIGWDVMLECIDKAQESRS